MKITKVDIPAALTNNADGLEHIKMDRLGEVVLFAGKNGSGKSRILSKIVNTLSQKPTKKQRDEATNELKRFRLDLPSHEKHLRHVQDQLINKADIDRSKVEMQFTDAQKSIEAIKERIRINEYMLSWDLIETSEYADKYTAISFVPTTYELQDCNNISKDEMTSRAGRIHQVGVDHLHQTCISKIQIVQNIWFEAINNTSSRISDEERADAIADYNRLKHLLKLFLGAEIDRTLHSDAYLFEDSIGKAKMSPGQKILLQFCMAIFSQKAELENLILILDEPENHLHPAAVIETLDSIRECIPKGQIWIATHSIPVLAHFDPSYLWYVENNRVSYAGKIPEKVLQSLIGDDDQISKLHDFISLPSQFASSRYAFECFIEPQAVNNGPGDPQVIQINTELMKLLKLSNTDKLRVLDYGAGKGRIISNIPDVNDPSFIIDYIAYDQLSHDKAVCENAVKKAYGSYDKRYFNDMNKLFSIYDKNSFNVVIMCNVLHEIEPNEWFNLFSTGGTIPSLLKDNGILLLIEDHQIPTGEKAYQKGFLVLDTPQLKELFKITEKDNDFMVKDLRGDGRLKAHHIPKRCLMQIDENTRRKAITDLCTLAKNKIIELRKKEASYKNGRLHAFWTQQFANAHLILSELSPGSDT